MENNDSNVLNNVEGMDEILEFLYKGFSNSDILYAEDFDPTIKTTFFDDYVIKFSNVLMNNIDCIYFYDELLAQMDGGAKCSVTNNVYILWNFFWYDETKRTYCTYERCHFRTAYFSS